MSAKSLADLIELSECGNFVVIRREHITSEYLADLLKSIQRAEEGGYADLLTRCKKKVQDSEKST